jgi:hypothetical protein
MNLREKANYGDQCDYGCRNNKVYQVEERLSLQKEG